VGPHRCLVALADFLEIKHALLHLSDFHRGPAFP
jgi:hypothetical protein